MTEPVRVAGHSYAPWATPAAAQAAAVAAAVAAHSATANCTKLMTAIKFFSLAPFAGCRCVTACRTNVNQRVCKCKVNSQQGKGKTFVQLSAKRRRHMSMAKRARRGKPGNCRAASSTKSSAQRDKQSSSPSLPFPPPTTLLALLCSPLA